MMKQFKIIVPSFNCVDYLGKCLSSIEIQDYKNYQVCVIDDASTIKKQREIILEFCNRNGWKYRFHDKNMGAVYGLVHSLREFGCDDDDVVVVLDGDDWFAHDHALSVVHEAYAKNDIYLTWGQCERYPPGNPPMRYAQPIPDMIIDQQLFREIPFVFRHLQTFKYYLWRHIRDEDLRDINGEYFRLLYDKATTFPMLEMAGGKIHFIKDVIYIYNLENPLNDYATSTREEFERVDQCIKNKQRYSTLDFDHRD